MSCLYSSPEVASLGLSLSWSFRRSWFGNVVVSQYRRFVMSLRPIRHALHAPNRSAVKFHTDFAVRRGQQRRVPQQPGVRRPVHRFIQPAKTSTGFSRDFSSAISGFRSLCGRKQRSSLKPSRSIGPAFWNLSLGAGSLALRTLAFTRSIYGASNPGPMLWAERSRSRGIFQAISCIPIGLYEGNFRNATARRMPARSSLGGPRRASPIAAINRRTSPLWPSPNSTTNIPPGASRRAASGAIAR